MGKLEKEKDVAASSREKIKELVQKNSEAYGHLLQNSLASFWHKMFLSEVNSAEMGKGQKYQFIN